MPLPDRLFVFASDSCFSLCWGGGAEYPGPDGNRAWESLSGFQEIHKDGFGNNVAGKRTALLVFRESAMSYLPLKRCRAQQCPDHEAAYFS